jgi:hypothetical protein
VQPAEVDPKVFVVPDSATSAPPETPGSLK